MTLFEECIHAIEDDHLKILSDEETEKYFDYLCSLFPVSPWGRIDWRNVSKKKKITSLSEILDWLRQNGMNDNDVIVLWNYSYYPGIQTKLEKILNSIDDVVAVGSDTFILCKNGEYIIEFFHDGEVTIGIPENKTRKM